MTTSSSALTASSSTNESLALMQNYFSMLDLSDNQLQTEVDRVKEQFQTSSAQLQQVSAKNTEDNNQLREQLSLVNKQIEELKQNHNREMAIKDQTIETHAATIQANADALHTGRALKDAFLEIVRSAKDAEERIRNLTGMWAPGPWERQMSITCAFSGQIMKLVRIPEHYVKNEFIKEAHLYHYYNYYKSHYGEDMEKLTKKKWPI